MPKTTLVIDDRLFQRLKSEALRQGKTLSQLVEAGIRLVLRRPRRGRVRLPELPTFDGGRALVDVADREALQRLLGGRW